MHTNYELKAGDLVVVLSHLRDGYGPGYANYVSRVDRIDLRYAHIVPLGTRREPGGFFPQQLQLLSSCTPDDLKGLLNLKELEEMDPMLFLRPLEELDA